MLLEAAPPAGPGELAGSVAGAVVGHDPLDDDAQRCVVGDGGLEEGYGTAVAPALHGLAEGHAGGVVDADMDVLPTTGAAVALALASPLPSSSYLLAPTQRLYHEMFH